VWQSFQKLKTEVPYGLAIPLLGIYLKKRRSLSKKYICIPMFTATLCTIAKDMETN